MYSKFLSIALISVLSLMLLLSGCGEGETVSETDAAEEKDASALTVSIATDNSAEQNLLANLAKILIEKKTDAKVKIVYYQDSTASSYLSKCKSGDVDVIFCYTGDIAVDGLEMTRDDINIGTILPDLQNDLKQQYNINLSEGLGFESTLRLYMTDELKEESGVSTCSGLQDVCSDYTIGMPESFYNRIDCYEAFCDTYELTFKKAVVYEEEEGFSALASGKIDVYVGSSVSPFYSLMDVSRISDDKDFFLPQECCYGINISLMEEYPEIEDALENMEGLISEGRMSLMIRRVYKEGNNITDYINTYLRANNII